ncbi:MAG: hypothetical protein Q7T44_05880 [Parvibaculum sp.]|nr:hypothetical protein [Parvibaculum sp.]
MANANKKEVIGICHLCKNLRPLCNSHAIPHSFFREIHQRNNGQAIVISSAPGPLRKSNDSGADRLLCSECENKLGNDLDAPAYHWMKSTQEKLLKGAVSGSVEVNSTMMAKFITSMFWRASVSKNDLYKNLIVSQQEREIMRMSIIENGNPFEQMSFSIANLYDSKKQFDGVSLSEFILQPTTWTNANKPSKQKLLFLTIKGFLIVLITPRVKPSERSRPIYLSPKKDRIFLRPSDVRTNPKFMEMHDVALSKVIERDSKQVDDRA